MLRAFNVLALSRLIADTSYDDKFPMMLEEVDSVARSIVNLAFRYAFSNGFYVPKVTKLKPTQLRADLGSGFYTIVDPEIKTMV